MFTSEKNTIVNIGLKIYISLTVLHNTNQRKTNWLLYKFSGVGGGVWDILPIYGAFG